MGPQLNAPICGEPELAVGAVDDGKRGYIKVKKIGGGGQVRLQQRENLSQQGRGFLTSDRFRPNCLERFAGYPLILHGTPDPTVVMPETAVSAEHQVQLSPIAQCRSRRITPSGGVEASSTPTIRRLIPSCRHQLSPIARDARRDAGESG
jgi:hypothetical protein